MLPKNEQFLTNGIFILYLPVLYFNYVNIVISPSYVTWCENCKEIQNMLMTDISLNFGHLFCGKVFTLRDLAPRIVLE